MAEKFDKRGIQHPVPEQLLPEVQLSEEQRDTFQDICNKVLQNTRMEYSDFHGHVDKERWYFVRERSGIKVYRDRTVAKSQSALMMCTGFIHGSIEDVMNGLYCDTTEELRKVRSILNPKFLDGAVLHVDERRTSDDPFRFAGIKWCATRYFQTSHIVNHRDVVCYECMGSTTDMYGQEMAFHVLQAVDLPEFPAFRKKNIIRAHISMCYLYRKLREDLVEVYMLGQSDANGNIPDYLLEIGVADKCLSVTHTLKSSYAKQYAALMKANQAKKRSWSKICDLCRSVPNILDSHTHCAGCKKRVCRRCRDVKVVFKLRPRSGRPEKHAFCSICIENVDPAGMKKRELHRSQSTPLNSGDFLYMKAHEKHLRASMSRSYSFQGSSSRKRSFVTSATWSETADTMFIQDEINVMSDSDSDSEAGKIRFLLKDIDPFEELSVMEKLKLSILDLAEADQEEEDKAKGVVLYDEGDFTQLKEKPLSDSPTSSASLSSSSSSSSSSLSLPALPPMESTDSFDTSQLPVKEAYSMEDLSPLSGTSRLDRCSKNEKFRIDLYSSLLASMEPIRS